MDKLLLQLERVTKSFGAVQALKGVSFGLRAGEVHALLGENGAGKSTLIKIITGAHQPDDGRLEILGQPVKHLTPSAAHKLGIACIYQQPALFPDLSVPKILAFASSRQKAFNGSTGLNAGTRNSELLKRVGAVIDPDAEVRCAFNAGAATRGNCLRTRGGSAHFDHG